jgi:hypothetical protein
MTQLSKQRWVRARRLLFFFKSLRVVLFKIMFMIDLIKIQTNFKRISTVIFVLQAGPWLRLRHTPQTENGAAPPPFLFMG